MSVLFLDQVIKWGCWIIEGWGEYCKAKKKCLDGAFADESLGLIHRLGLKRHLYKSGPKMLVGFRIGWESICKISKNQHCLK